MSGHKQALTFKKSVLSIVVVSAVTGGLMIFEKQHRLPESFNSKINQALVENSLGSTELQELAVIEQENSLVEQQNVTEQALQSIADQKVIAEQQTAVQESTVSETQVAEQIEVKPTAIEYELLFALNSREIAAGYYTSLNEIAESMQKISAVEPQAIWQVVGYADPTGNALYNQKLAKKRAQAVAEFLVTKGVNKAQLAIVSLGDSQQQEGATDNRLQRRVEIHPYRAEIVALAEQLHKKTLHQLADEKNNQQKNALSEDVAEQAVTAEQQLPASFPEVIKPLATAMEF
jgi:outer membrane protein OmpA-like peptidoglycan-associated protein